MPRFMPCSNAVAVVGVLLACTPVRGYAQKASACPSCEAASALIERFGLREDATPVRQRPGWSAPRRIVTWGGEDLARLLRTVAPNAEVTGVANIPEALAALPGADVWVGLCTPDIIRVATDLKWVQLLSAGAELCAGLPAVAQRNILMTNTQAIYGPQISELAISMILSFARRLHVYSLEQRRGQWSHAVADPEVALNAGFWELEGKKLLVVGLGGIGTEVAKRAHALGMTVRATRNSGRTGPEFVEYVGLSDEYIELARWADVVVNATPLTPQTRGMFNAAFFAAMKPTAYFINVGRGESVVTPDLVAALQQGGIAGAGLDVTDPEPLPTGHPLWSMPNVILTPHMAAGSDRVLQRITVLVMENLRRYVNGDRLLSVVDISRGY